MSVKKLLVIEPFYGGSHKQLLDTLRKEFFEDEFDLYTLPAKKWHWRARTSALYFSQVIPFNHRYKTLFSSSVLNLAELIALRSDLRDVRTVIYFHENQLVYPMQNEKERDFQYGYNQILTCLVADVLLFNSNYNANSFLNSIQSFLRKQPDFRVDVPKDQILSKSRVLYFPIDLKALHSSKKRSSSESIVHIAWPHRWEHDKNFDDFFAALKGLKDAGYKFVLSIFGEQYGKIPDSFLKAREELSNRIVHFGYVDSKEEYYDLLRTVDIVVSTARHEFFGVAILEATYLGCLPLCPRALVYPELYPDWCLFSPTVSGLLNKLKEYCDPRKVREMRSVLTIPWERYDAKNVLPDLRRILFPYQSDANVTTTPCEKTSLT